MINRRGFLRKLAGAGMAALVPLPALAPLDMTKEFMAHQQAMTVLHGTITVWFPP